MRFTDLVCTTDKGIYCPPGDFYIDPVRAVASRARHARPFRPCAPRTWRRARHAGDAAHHGRALRRGFCRLAPGGGARRGGFDRRRPRHVPSRRPRARLRPGRRREGRPADRRLGRLQAARRPDLPRLRAGALRRLHHRGDLRAAGVPPSRRPRRDPKAARLGRASSPTARISSAPMRSARRSASSRCLREAGYAEPIYIHGALQRLCELYQEEGVDLGPLEPATLEKGRKHDFAGAIVIGPPSAFADRWARRFADPVACFASGWMRVRQRARQRGVELPLVISDHCDWDEICDTIREVGPRGGLGDAWQRGGAGALVRAAGPPRKTAASDGLRGGDRNERACTSRRGRRRSPTSARSSPPTPPASTMPTPAR